MGMEIKLPSAVYKDESGQIYISLHSWGNLKRDVEAHNKMLSDGVEVHTDDDPERAVWYHSGTCLSEKRTHHKAILIKIQPIGKDSETQLLRDMVKSFKDSTPFFHSGDFLKRAKALGVDCGDV